MKYKMIMNLRLFDDGGAGGDGGTTGGSAGTGNSGQKANAGYTYEQLEEVANARAQRAERTALADFFRKQGMSEADITSAIADYKTNKEKNKPNLSEIEQERDTYKSEAEQLKNEKVLSAKGVKADDLDYVMFKVSKLVDDKTDFNKAAEKFLKENPRYTGAGSYRVSTSTSTGEKGSGDNLNTSINNAIRLAARR
ncbi:MAG: hypothetical protein Q4D16_03460 [Eubacteriales bacterium]|nr:hypothetical protein [Eubacteriales bacterium]